MNLLDIMQPRLLADDPWSGRYKIPWDDPEFSRRMLKEHLNQDHDLASRRQETIKRHIQWIHQRMLAGRPSLLLDLGCGPGLYLNGLAALGHGGRGIDFSPASIAYARQNQAPGDSCEFVQEDLRTASFGQGYDLAMMIFGEINVFSPRECAGILAKAQAALKPGGRLFLEAHTYQVVRGMGQAENTWYKAEAGLFSDQPHLCLVENHWSQEHQASLQFFHVIDPVTGRTKTHRSTTKAWTDDDYRRLLSEAGFTDLAQHPDWPGRSDAFLVWSARRS